ncbi:Kinesin-like protein unc-104 [Diplonema papillatum]|nr:Kinesin-like protein unc-104 [Diplonema papillatum]
MREQSKWRKVGAGPVKINYIHVRRFHRKLSSACESGEIALFIADAIMRWIETARRSAKRTRVLGLREGGNQRRRARNNRLALVQSLMTDVVTLRNREAVKNSPKLQRAIENWWQRLPGKDEHDTIGFSTYEWLYEELYDMVAPDYAGDVSDYIEEDWVADCNRNGPATRLNAGLFGRSILNFLETVDASHTVSSYLALIRKAVARLLGQGAHVVDLEALYDDADPPETPQDEAPEEEGEQPPEGGEGGPGGSAAAADKAPLVASMSFHEIRAALPPAPGDEPAAADDDDDGSDAESPANSPTRAAAAARGAAAALPAAAAAAGASATATAATKAAAPPKPADGPAAEEARMGEAKRASGSSPADGCDANGSGKGGGKGGPAGMGGTLSGGGDAGAAAVEELDVTQGGTCEKEEGRASDAEGGGGGGEPAARRAGKRGSSGAFRDGSAPGKSGKKKQSGAADPGTKQAQASLAEARREVDAMRRKFRDEDSALLGCLSLTVIAASAMLFAQQQQQGDADGGEVPGRSGKGAPAGSRRKQKGPPASKAQSNGKHQQQQQQPAPRRPRPPNNPGSTKRRRASPVGGSRHPPLAGRRSSSAVAGGQHAPGSAPLSESLRQQQQDESPATLAPPHALLARDELQSSHTPARKSIVPRRGQQDPPSKLAGVQSRDDGSREVFDSTLTDEDWNKMKASFTGFSKEPSTSNDKLLPSQKELKGDSTLDEFASMPLFGTENVSTRLPNEQRRSASLKVLDPKRQDQPTPATALPVNGRDRGTHVATDARSPTLLDESVGSQSAYANSVGGVGVTGSCVEPAVTSESSAGTVQKPDLEVLSGIVREQLAAGLRQPTLVKAHKLSHLRLPIKPESGYQATLQTEILRAQLHSGPVATSDLPSNQAPSRSAEVGTGRKKRLLKKRARKRSRVASASAARNSRQKAQSRPGNDITSESEGEGWEETGETSDGKEDADTGIKDPQNQSHGSVDDPNYVPVYGAISESQAVKANRRSSKSFLFLSALASGQPGVAASPTGTGATSVGISAFTPVTSLVLDCDSPSFKQGSIHRGGLSFKTVNALSSDARAAETARTPDNGSFDFMRFLQKEEVAQRVQPTAVTSLLTSLGDLKSPPKSGSVNSGNPAEPTSEDVLLESGSEAGTGTPEASKDDTPGATSRGGVRVQKQSGFSLELLRSGLFRTGSRAAAPQAGEEHRPAETQNDTAHVQKPADFSSGFPRVSVHYDDLTEGASPLVFAPTGGVMASPVSEEVASNQPSPLGEQDASNVPLPVVEHAVVEHDAAPRPGTVCEQDASVPLTIDKHDAANHPSRSVPEDRTAAAVRRRKSSLTFKRPMPRRTSRVGKDKQPVVDEFAADESSLRTSNSWSGSVPSTKPHDGPDFVLRRGTMQMVASKKVVNRHRGNDAGNLLSFLQNRGENMVLLGSPAVQRSGKSKSREGRVPSYKTIPQSPALDDFGRDGLSGWGSECSSLNTPSSSLGNSGGFSVSANPAEPRVAHSGIHTPNDNQPRARRSQVPLLHALEKSPRRSASRSEARPSLHDLHLVAGQLSDRESRTPSPPSGFVSSRSRNSVASHHSAMDQLVDLEAHHQRALQNLMPVVHRSLMHRPASREPSMSPRAGHLENWNSRQVASYLRAHGVKDEVCLAFRRHGVDGLTLRGGNQGALHFLANAHLSKKELQKLIQVCRILPAPHSVGAAKMAVLTERSVMPSKLRQRLSEMLQETAMFLDRPSEEHIFAAPATRLFQLPDYKWKVQHPMDLETIAKSAKDKYVSVDEFAYDIRLMVRNCRVYNGEGTLYDTYGQNLLQDAEEFIVRLKKKWVAAQEEHPEHAAFMHQMAIKRLKQHPLTRLEGKAGGAPSEDARKKRGRNGTSKTKKVSPDREPEPKPTETLPGAKRRAVATAQPPEGDAAGHSNDAGNGTAEVPPGDLAQLPNDHDTALRPASSEANQQIPSKSTSPTPSARGRVVSGVVCTALQHPPDKLGYGALTRVLRQHLLQHDDKMRSLATSPDEAVIRSFMRLAEEKWTVAGAVAAFRKKIDARAYLRDEEFDAFATVCDGILQAFDDNLARSLLYPAERRVHEAFVINVLQTQRDAIEPDAFAWSQFYPAPYLVRLLACLPSELQAASCSKSETRTILHVVQHLILFLDANWDTFAAPMGKRPALLSGNVEVAVRVRPLLEKEQQRGEELCLAVASSSKAVRLEKPPVVVGNTVLPSGGQSWAFDHIFNPDTTQEDVMETIGTPAVHHAFLGYHSCILAYGQTGSGKTYTMEGPDDGSAVTRGLIPRLCRKLFEDAENKKATPQAHGGTAGAVQYDYQAEVSHVEIYNEKVRCLLQPKSAEPRIREHPVTGPYVDGATKCSVHSADEIQKLLKRASRARTVAATRGNDRSSRSHALFIVTFTQIEALQDGSNLEKESRITLVDLAGSERVWATDTTSKEGANINRSLTALGNVINLLSERETASLNSSQAASSPRHVPYRDSALTWILRESLGGNSKTNLICTLSPTMSSYDLTLSTLRFAERAKCLVTRPVVNEDPSKRKIRLLVEEVESLKSQLERRDSSPIPATLSPPGTPTTETYDMLSTERRLRESETVLEGLKEEWEARVSQFASLQYTQVADLSNTVEKQHSLGTKLQELLALSRQATIEDMASRLEQNAKREDETRTRLTTELAVSQKEANDLRLQLYRRTQQRDNLQKEQQRWEADIAAARREISRLQREAQRETSLAQNLAEADEKLQRLRGDNARLVAENKNQARLLRHREAKQERDKELETERHEQVKMSMAEAAATEVERLRRELSDLTQICSSQQNMITELEKELKESKQTVKVVKEVGDNAITTLSETLQVTLQRLEVHEANESKVAATHEELAALQRKNTSMSDMIETLERVVQQQTNALAEKERQLMQAQSPPAHENDAALGDTPSNSGSPSRWRQWLNSEDDGTSPVLNRSQISPPRVRP